MGRPSPEERAEERRKKEIKREIDRLPKSTITRAGKANAAKLESKLKSLSKKSLAELRAEASAQKPPTEIVGGSKTIFRGGRSFPDDFRKDFWNGSEAAAENDGKKLTCALCNKEIKPRDKRAIDHKIPWATLKTEIEPQKVCKSGNHWNVVLQSDANKVICDERLDDQPAHKRKNLQPAHKSCNSRKGGPINTDSIVPQPAREPCPGPACSLPKAQ